MRRRSFATIWAILPAFSRDARVAMTGRPFTTCRGGRAASSSTATAGCPPFLIRGKDLAALAEFTEYRIRQTDFDKIVIEIGGRSKLSTDEVSAIKAFLEQRAGQEFEIEVRAC